MFLFVWDKVLQDYTHGVAFAYAPNVETARKKLVESYITWLQDMYLWDPEDTPEDNLYSRRLVEDLKSPPRVVDNEEYYFVMQGGA
jgi:hypothetical protein